MTIVEEIEIGQVGGSGGLRIGKLAVVTREEEITEEDQPVELGSMYVVPESVPFVGVSETIASVSDNVIVTAADLITFYNALDVGLPITSLIAAFGEQRTKTCARILEKIGVVVDDGSGSKFNKTAVQELVDQVSDLCIR